MLSMAGLLRSMPHLRPRAVTGFACGPALAVKVPGNPRGMIRSTGATQASKF